MIESSKVKIIKCRRCKRKKNENEDWNGLKTCPICHEKDRGDSRVRSEKRKQDRPSVELVENLKFSEPLPQFLTNFSEFQKYWRMHNQEVKFEDYIKELNAHKMREVQKQIDTQVSKTKGHFQAKKQILMKFLRFDLFTPSNRDDCTKFRLQKLGLWHEEEGWLAEHKDLCEECGHWLYNLENDRLDSIEGKYIHITYVWCFPKWEQFEKLMKKCPIHGCKMEFVSKDDKLKKITLLCESQTQQDGYNEVVGYSHYSGNRPSFNYQSQNGANGLQDTLDEYDRQKKERDSQ